MIRTSRKNLPTYVTRDGSSICELMHPQHHPVRAQSLAEARVEPGQTTRLHQHNVTEELYYIVSGQGLMRVGEETNEVGAGDTVLIPPGSAHCISNLGTTDLVILCCCAPAYRHDDTVLL